MKRTLLLLFLSIAFPAHAQKTPEDLGKLWVESIKANSVDMLKPLVHPDCPKDAIKSEIINRMISGYLPPSYTIRAVALDGSKEMLAKAYIIIPDMQLNIDYNTTNKEDRMKFGIGKAFPVAKKNGRWYFTICTQPYAKPTNKKHE